MYVYYEQTYYWSFRLCFHFTHMLNQNVWLWRCSTGPWGLCLIRWSRWDAPHDTKVRNCWLPPKMDESSAGWGTWVKCLFFKQKQQEQQEWQQKGKKKKKKKKNKNNSNRKIKHEQSRVVWFADSVAAVFVIGICILASTHCKWQ